MKRILFSVFALLFSVFVYSQTIVENPKFGLSTASNLKIEKIEIRDTATVLWIHVIAGPGNKILVPGETYIQPVGKKEKLFVLSAEGIVMNEWVPMSASGDIRYQLFFPKVDPSIAKIDFGEGNEGGSWFIYDIQLKPELFKSIVPEGITGNWFRNDNAQWEISLFDSVAVYKSKVWKYLKYAETGGLGKISLKSGSKTLAIYAKAGDDSTCHIGETPAKLIKYSKRPNPSVIPEDQELFKLPVFKIDTVTYCGYIKGFSPRYSNHTGMVYVNNVLTGEQDPYTIKIEDDGTFLLKFLYCNPQLVLVRHPFFTEKLFMEPGKTTFQLIDNGSKTNPVLFMGDCARINMDLIKLKDINSYDNQKKRKPVNEYTPEQYSSSVKEDLQKDLEALTDFTRHDQISAKAFQVKKLELEYINYSKYFDFGSKVDTSYYGFLTNDLVNNPLAVLSSQYFLFINRLMILDILRGKPKGFWTSDYMNAWEIKGNKLSPGEKLLYDQLKEFDTPEFKNFLDEFQFKYGEQETNLQRKYNKQIQAIYKEKKDTTVTYAMIEKYLIGQNVAFTDDEKLLLSALKAREVNPLVKKHDQFYEQHQEQLDQFEQDHHQLLVEVFQEYSKSKRDEKLKEVLGIQLDFASDVMASQNYCRPIVAEMTPITDDKLKEYQKNISTPFIANYLALKNNEAKAKVEANKKLKGAVVNDVPKTAADKVFDAIMGKYKGKVVYVDFWATWCSPCRAGIERIKPLKDEMANENLAFVYITNQTSPKATYDNMIPSIKGEHYRVSADEWNVLCGKFKISGIPHYVLVGKDGKVINPHLSHMDNPQLKTLLMKCIKE